MPDQITLILKACGHYGLVSEQYDGNEICCSQCEVLDEKKWAVIPIVKKKVVAKGDVPAARFREMDRWIRKQLELPETASHNHNVPMANDKADFGPAASSIASSEK